MNPQHKTYKALRRAPQWVRWSLAILLILGGLLSFLPILGIWMLPLGLMLLAPDSPWLYRQMVSLKARGKARRRGAASETS